MNYKPREGVALVSICDAFLLIPTRKVSVECHHSIIQLSLIEAVFWKQLLKGKSPAEIAQSFSHISFQSIDKAAHKVNSTFQKLCEKGFLIPVEDDAT